jgi:hypothetical protein
MDYENISEEIQAELDYVMNVFGYDVLEIRHACHASVMLCIERDSLLEGFLTGHTRGIVLT